MVVAIIYYDAKLKQKEQSFLFLLLLVCVGLVFFSFLFFLLFYLKEDLVAKINFDI